MDILDGYTNPYHIYLVNIEMFRLDSVYEILASVIRLTFSVFLALSYLVLSGSTAFSFTFESIVYWGSVCVFYGRPPVNCKSSWRCCEAGLAGIYKYFSSYQY